MIYHIKIFYTIFFIELYTYLLMNIMFNDSIINRKKFRNW